MKTESALWMLKRKQMAGRPFQLTMSDRGTLGTFWSVYVLPIRHRGRIADLTLMLHVAPCTGFHRDHSWHGGGIHNIGIIIILLILIIIYCTCMYDNNSWIRCLRHYHDCLQQGGQGHFIHHQCVAPKTFPVLFPRIHWQRAWTRAREWRRRHHIQIHTL